MTEQITYSLQSALLGLKKRPTLLHTKGVKGFEVVGLTVGFTVFLMVGFRVVCLIVVGFLVVGILVMGLGVVGFLVVG